MNALGLAEKIEVVTLIDNYVDVLIPSHQKVVREPHYRNGTVAPPLVAEHGLSLLVRVFQNGHAHTLLLDAGWSETGVQYNMAELGIPVSEIEGIILSHGHMDHHGGLKALLRQRTAPVPVITHPDVFLKNRYIVSSQGDKIAFPLLDKDSLKRLGAQVIDNKEPYFLVSDLVLVSGEIERITDFEKGLPNAYVEKDGKIERDRILDDQALIVHLKNKGLVIITGCSHAGIINTIYYAQKITGVLSVHAVIGGFHLSGASFEPIIGKTLEQLKAIDPEIICPMHCTGWQATKKIAEHMPSQFVLSSVGTTMTL